MKLGSKKNTANFFWYGSELTIYDKACLRSFLNCGFKVVVYSFKKLNSQVMLFLKMLTRY